MATDTMGHPSNQRGPRNVDATLRRIHDGLPSDTPWFFRVVLGNRAFLFATVMVTVVLGAIAASNPAWLLAFDEPVSEWIRGFVTDGNVAVFVTTLGSPNLAMVLGVVGVAIVWRRCRASAVTLGLLVASATVADIVLKLVVDRPRPPSPLVDTGLGSFPSGHVIHAVVIFGLIPIVLWAATNSHTYLRLGFGVFSVAVVGVAVSRIALGAHWPSDVIASFLIGSSLLLGAQFLIRSTWATDRCATLGLHSDH